jgi:hypothetical protein
MAQQGQQLPPAPIYPPNGPYTIEMGMRACGATAAEAPVLAENIFNSTTAFSKNVSDDEVKDVFKTLSEITSANRRIRLLPRVKRNIRAYNTWIKHLYRLGRDPVMTVYRPMIDTDKMMEIQKHMDRFTSNKATTSSVAEPDTFTKDMEWRD